MADYDAVLGDLRRAYDGAVDERRAKPVEPWKSLEREAFLTRVRAADGSRLLEVGAGTGVHGRWFADQGLAVVCSDNSPAMVAACRAEGLEAFESDFLSLPPSGDFDAVFAMNCVLHVPPDALVAVLAAIAGTLRPGGLFFLGQYGGVARTGAFDDDLYEPKRYFSSVTDDHLVGAVTEAGFVVVDFHTVDLGGDDEGTHFQSATSTRREDD